MEDMIASVCVPKKTLIYRFKTCFAKKPKKSEQKVIKVLVMHENLDSPSTCTLINNYNLSLLSTTSLPKYSNF